MVVQKFNEQAIAGLNGSRKRVAAIRLSVTCLAPVPDYAGRHGSRPLHVACLQQQKNSVHGKGISHRAAAEFRASERMYSSLQRDPELAGVGVMRLGAGPETCAWPAARKHTHVSTHPNGSLRKALFICGYLKCPDSADPRFAASGRPRDPAPCARLSFLRFKTLRGVCQSAGEKASTPNARRSAQARGKVSST
jgi:hypothetical protein